MTFDLLIAYIGKLIEDKCTGQVRVNLHKGDLSEKIEVKLPHHLKEMNE